MSYFFVKVWFSNRRAKYRREDKVKGRRQHQQLLNDMGENMRPSGATPPPPPPPIPTASSSMYPHMFPTNNNSIDQNHPHHQYGAFSSGFTAACTSTGYPSFFPSIIDILFSIASRNSHIRFLFSFNTWL